MASVSYLTCSSIKCSINKDGNEYLKKGIITSSIKINGNSSSFHDVMNKDHDLLMKNNNGGVAATITSSVVDVADVCQIGNTKEETIRQNIPTKKQLVDLYRQGQLITEGTSNGGYRQTVVIRSYEVGADKTATIETILNLFQETALNHVWMSGLLGDGFGATHGMMRNNLIWVVSRMKVQVDHYPVWGEVLEVETWVGSSGKNGMRRDWLIRSHATGHVYARATSTWVMMNQESRRLSKMPDEVRAEVTPWFSEKLAIQEDIIPDKIEKLGKIAAKYVKSGLQAKRSDLDMNQHVNNVKYVGWILETIPDNFLDSHELSELILEYRRECGSSDIVESLCEPNGSNGILDDDDDDIEDGGGLNTDEIKHNYKKITDHLNGFPFSSSGILQGLRSLIPGPASFTHLLRIDGNTKNEELVRGKTIWKKKINVP